MFKNDIWSKNKKIKNNLYDIHRLTPKHLSPQLTCCVCGGLCFVLHHAKKIKTIWCKISDCICIHPLFKMADLIQLLGADPSRHSSSGCVHPWQDASSSQDLHMGTNNHLRSHLHLWQFRLRVEPHLYVFWLWDEAIVPRGNPCRHGRTC